MNYELGLELLECLFSNNSNRFKGRESNELKNEI